MQGLEFHLTGLWLPEATTVPYYGRISDPLAGSVQIPRNESRTASVTVSTRDPVLEPLAALVQVPYAVMLKAYYRGLLVFWGPVKVRGGQFGAGTVRLDAVDMSLRFIKHFLGRGDLAVTGQGEFTAANDDVGFVTLDDNGLRALRDAVDTVSFPTLGVPDGTTDVTPAPLSKMEVSRSDQVWNSMLQLSQTDGAPDFELEPVDNTVQTYAKLNTFTKQGTDRTAAVQFHYGTGLANLEDLEFVEGEEYVNLVHVQDRDKKYLKTTTNATALARTGPYIDWDTTDFGAPAGSTQAQAEAVLGAYGRGLITAYSQPLTALTATLPVDTATSLRYGTDFFIGDTIGVAGKDGYLTLPLGAYRIERVGLALDGSDGATRTSLDVVADRTSGDTIDNSGA